METTTFTAVCERAGRWWTIRVPQVDGLTAQARSLDQAEIIARQSIARALGTPPEAINVDVRPDAPAPAGRALQARRAARLAVAAADQATRDALEALAQDGYAFPDAATMLALTAAEIQRYRPARRDAPASPLPVAPLPVAPPPVAPPAGVTPLQLAGQ